MLVGEASEVLAAVDVVGAYAHLHGVRAGELMHAVTRRLQNRNRGWGEVDNNKVLTTGQMRNFTAGQTRIL